VSISLSGEGVPLIKARFCRNAKTDNYELLHGLPNRPFSVFAHFGAQTPGRISETGGPICTKLQEMIAQSSAQKKFASAFRKIAPFWNGRRAIGFGVDKNGSKFCGF